MDPGIFTKYFNGNMSRKERDKFESLLDQTPELRAELEDFRQLWEVTREYKSKYHPDPLATWNTIRKHTLDREGTPLHTRFSLPAFIRIASGIALIIALGISFYLVNPSGVFIKYTQIYQATDSILKVVLPDNSVVWLNKNSTLYSPLAFTNNYRKVKLLGEGFFQIAHDTKHPFIVKGKTASVEDLGTSFNLKITDRPEDLKVVVTTGKVRFRTRGQISMQRWILNPGDKICFNKSTGSLEESRVGDKNYLAWKDGWFRFSNTPVGQVFSQLTEFYGADFRLEEGIPEGLTLSGNFRTDSLSKILEVIELSLDLKISLTPGKKYIVQSTNPD